MLTLSKDNMTVFSNGTIDINDGEILKGPKPCSISQLGKYETFITWSSLGLFVVNLILLEEIIRSVIIKSSSFEEFIFTPVGSSITLYSSK